MNEFQDFNDWVATKVLADHLEVTPGAIREAFAKGHKVKGHTLERRMEGRRAFFRIVDELEEEAAENGEIIHKRGAYTIVEESGEFDSIPYDLYRSVVDELRKYRVRANHAEARLANLESDPSILCELELAKGEIEALKTKLKEESQARSAAEKLRSEHFEQGLDTYHKLLAVSEERDELRQELQNARGEIALTKRKLKDAEELCTALRMDRDEISEELDKVYASESKLAQRNANLQTELQAAKALLEEAQDPGGRLKRAIVDLGLSALKGRK